MADAQTDPHRDLGGYVLRNLTEEEAASFEQHLAACEACRTELDGLGSIPPLLTDARGITLPDLPPGLRARTLAAVGAATRQEEAEIVDLESRRRARRERRSAWGRRSVLAVASAAAAIAVMIGVFGFRPSPSEDPATEIALGQTPGDIRVRKESGGWRIELDAELPRRDNPSYYEGFVEGPDGRVSVGTFNEANGVVLWAGVPLTVHKTFVIVAQPDGHDVSRTHMEVPRPGEG